MRVMSGKTTAFASPMAGCSHQPQDSELDGPALERSDTCSLCPLLATIQPCPRGAQLRVGQHGGIRGTTAQHRASLLWVGPVPLELGATSDPPAVTLVASTLRVSLTPDLGALGPNLPLPDRVTLCTSGPVIRTASLMRGSLRILLVPTLCPTPRTPWSCVSWRPGT